MKYFGKEPRRIAVVPDWANPMSEQRAPLIYRLEIFPIDIKCRKTPRAYLRAMFNDFERRIIEELEYRDLIPMKRKASLRKIVTPKRPRRRAGKSI